jgi:hypothetical protein
MATTSKYAFIMDTLRAQLKKESTFDVRKVFNLETALSTAKTSVYVNIIDDNPLGQVNESSAAYYGMRECRVGIYAIQHTPVDSNDLGTDAVLHGQIVEKIEKRLDAMNATFPTADTTTAGYLVSIHSCREDRVTGYVSDGSQAVAVLYEIVFTYTQQ